MIHAELFRALSVASLSVFASATAPPIPYAASVSSASSLLVPSVDSVLLLAPTYAVPKKAAARVAPPLPPAAPNALFTDKERAAILQYWSKPGRYVVGAPAQTPTSTGPWQVRLTTDGSTWFLAYQRAVVGPGKIPPTRDVHPTSGPFAEWETWVTARLTWDRYQAQVAANEANARALASTTGANSATPVRAIVPALPAPPPQPGPIPPGLLAACGNPPAFAASVLPIEYRVVLDDPDETFVYTDNVKMRERYGYYRFAQGVVSYGPRIEKMAPSECDKLFRAAGFTPSEQKAFCAVSAHEGGFETVQTYDTGFVSVGFIQFVTLEEGKHDLSAVLLQMKADRPDEYERDFRRFGIDVQPDRTITVIDPATGAELSSRDAVRRIIDDKRLTAVFQRAGRRSGFRVAQIKVARSYYWPVDDPLEVPMPDGTTLVGHVRDVVRSEAGIATLLDRKINIGNIRALAPVVRRVMTSHGCRTFADAALYEREIITAMKYREDFLQNTALTQPKPIPAVAPAPAPMPPVPMPVVPAPMPTSPTVGAAKSKLPVRIAAPSPRVSANPAIASPKPSATPTAPVNITLPTPTATQSDTEKFNVNSTPMPAPSASPTPIRSASPTPSPSPVASATPPSEP